MRKQNTWGLWACFVIGLGLASTASADCPPEDRVALEQEGYSAEEIDRLCQDGSPFAPPSGTSSSCVTSAGTCLLEDPIEIGSRCECDSVDGPIEGQVH